MKIIIEFIIRISFAFLKVALFLIEMKLGRVIVFHNVKTLWGESIKTASEFYNDWHFEKGRPIILQSKEGLLISIHGCKDGRMCLSRNSHITVEELAAMLPPGHYYLLSCYNGKRYDYDNGQVYIERVKNTRKWYISVSSAAIGTNLYVDCCWEFQKLFDIEKRLLKKYC